MLSDRQIQLLAHIIQEYMESPRPVGSTYLVEKYDLSCSAATVRNEMAELIEQGFLEMLHSSSGRIPTPQAYKFFLQELLEEDEIPVLQEVAIKQQVWGARYEIHKLLQELVSALADFTKELAVAITDTGFITQAGAVHLLDDKEFWNIEVAKAALSLVDKYELLRDVLNKPAYNKEQEVYCLVGDDLPGENLKQCSITTSKYETPRGKGFIAVLGPARMNYEKIIPSVRYAKNLVEELVQ